MLQNTEDTFSKLTVYACSQLCRQAHEACGPMEIDSALSTVQTLKNELQDAKMAAADSQLKPLPGETVRWAGSAFYSNCMKRFLFGGWCAQMSNILNAKPQNSHIALELHDGRDCPRALPLVL